VDIQRVGAQELDVNVVPADVFEQDKTDPKNPVLRLRDWLLDILSLRVASATLTNATISQVTVGSADITTLTTPTATKVVNLNADLLDNHHASNGSGDIPISNGTVNTGLNSDQLDGYHAGNSSSNVPINNSTLNTNLNADQLDGYHAGNGSGNVPISNGTTNTNLVAEKAITAWELKLQTVSASTTLQSDVCIVEVTTADAVTLTIPAGLPIGHQYRIKRTVSSANGISVACSGSETIEGLTSFTVQGSKVSAMLDTAEVVVEKVSSTAWSFVGGQVSGSNANGTWIKFSDGTMECWERLITTQLPANSWSYILYSYPTPFVSSPVCSAGWLVGSSWAGNPICTVGDRNSLGTAWNTALYPGSTAQTATLNLYAIGRWK
jgi:hypothetical protein